MAFPQIMCWVVMLTIGTRDWSGKILFFLQMCQGLNSHFFHIIGDGHQPNSRGLYTHYKDSYERWDEFIPNKTRLLTMAHMGSCP